MDAETKKEILSTFLENGDTDLANATVSYLASLPVKEYKPNEVTAASISRIWRHFNQSDIDKGIAIVSADRGDRVFVEQDGEFVLDEKKNKDQNKIMRGKLEALLRSIDNGEKRDKGFIRTKGGYKEEGVGLVYEYSYIIPNVSKKLASNLAKILGKDANLNKIKDPNEKVKAGQGKLANSFRQDSIIWGNSTSGAFLIFHNGKFSKIGSEMKMNNIQDLFTEWRRRRFSFGSACALIEYVPTSPSDYREWRAELEGF